MKYSNKERALAGLLSYVPFLKQPIKRVYQTANYLIYKKKFQYQSHTKLVQVSAGSYETFFGYYDKSPENAEKEFVVYHKTSLKTSKKPSSNFPVAIVLKNITTSEETVIDKSSSYNWQQGTKLQWISTERFIYNFFDSKVAAYKSKVYNVKSNKVEKIYKLPIYDCFKDEYAITLNFSRLARLRPDYGYRDLNNKLDLDPVTDDGIFYLDLKTNTSKLIISLQKLASFSPKDSMRNAQHKVNHIMISPDGANLMFLHRWNSSTGKRHDRLLISDSEGNGLRVLVDHDMVSHCCWYNNDCIIGFFRYPSNGDAFYKIDVKSASIELLSTKLKAFSDGHPSVVNDIMVFDTYPDKSRMKKLYLYDIKKDEVQEIGEFFEPLKFFGETRCDLHPKWSYYGSKIYIDSVHEGIRKLYYLANPQEETNLQDKN